MKVRRAHRLERLAVISEETPKHGADVISQEIEEVHGIERWIVRPDVLNACRRISDSVQAIELILHIMHHR